MIQYFYALHRIIHYNSIINITIVIINILIFPNHTAWMLFIIDWKRGVYNNSNIRQKWSISSRTNSARNSRLATRDLALTKTITTTILKTDISIIIITKKRDIQKRDTTTSNAEKDYRRRAWRSLMTGTGSWSENVGNWQRAASHYLKIERNSYEKSVARSQSPATTFSAREAPRSK